MAGPGTEPIRRVPDQGPKFVGYLGAAVIGVGVLAGLVWVLS